MKISLSTLSKVAYYAYHTLIVVLLICILGVTSGTFAKDTRILQTIEKGNGTLFHDPRGDLTGQSIVSMCESGYSIGELVIPLTDTCAVMTNLALEFSPLSSDKVPFFSSNYLVSQSSTNYDVSSDGKLTIAEYMAATQHAAMYISSIQSDASSYTIRLFLITADKTKVDLKKYALNHVNVAFDATKSFSITTQGTSEIYPCNSGTMPLPDEPNITDFPLDDSNFQSLKYTQNSRTVTAHPLTADMFIKVNGVEFLHMAEITIASPAYAAPTLTVDPQSVGIQRQSTVSTPLWNGACKTSVVWGVTYTATRALRGGDHFYMSFNPLYYESPIHQFSTSSQAQSTRFEVFWQKDSIDVLASELNEDNRPSVGFPDIYNPTFMSWLQPQITIGDTDISPTPILTSFVFDNALAIVNGNFTVDPSGGGEVDVAQDGSFIFGFFGKYLSNPGQVKVYGSDPTPTSDAALTFQFGGTVDGIVSAWNQRLAPVGLCKVKVSFGNEVIEDDNLLINGDFVLDGQQLARATTFSSLSYMGLDSTFFPPTFRLAGMYDGTYLPANTYRAPVLSSVSRAMGKSNGAFNRIRSGSNPVVMALNQVIGFMSLDIGYQGSVHACSGTAIGTPLAYLLFAAGFVFGEADTQGKAVQN